MFFARDILHGQHIRSATLKPPRGRTDLTILLWRNLGQAADAEIPTGLCTKLFSELTISFET